jgi:hypothetical protein
MVVVVIVHVIFVVVDVREQLSVEAVSVEAVLLWIHF